MSAKSLIVAAAVLVPLAASAQQPPAQPAPAPQQQPAGQQQPGGAQWDKLPPMQLEQIYRGPLRDTIVQRWRDPTLNVVCYIYLPITTAHTPPTDTGYVQYGSNTIGSVSCLPVAAPPPPANGGGTRGKGKAK